MEEYEKILKKYHKKEELWVQIVDNNTIILCCPYYGSKYNVGNVGNVYEFVYFRKKWGYAIKEKNNLITALFRMSGYEEEMTKLFETHSIGSKSRNLVIYKISENEYVCLDNKYLKKVFTKDLRLFTHFMNRDNSSSFGIVYLVDDNNEVKAVICSVKVENILKEIERVTKND